MPPPRKVGDRRAANWNLFSKNSRKIISLIGDLALTNMGLGDKAAAFKLIERAMAVVPIEKDALEGPASIEILARVAAQMGEPDRAIAALQKLLSIPYGGAFLTCRSLPRCSGSIQCSIRSGMIRASKNSAKRNRRHRINKARGNVTGLTSRSTIFLPIYAHLRRARDSCNKEVNKYQQRLSDSLGH